MLVKNIEFITPSLQYSSECRAIISKIKQNGYLLLTIRIFLDTIVEEVYVNGKEEVREVYQKIILPG